MYRWFLLLWLMIGATGFGQEELYERLKSRADDEQPGSTGQLHRSIRLFTPLNRYAARDAKILALQNEALAQGLDADEELAVCILQRAYIGIWVDGDIDCAPELEAAEKLFSPEASPDWLVAEYYRYKLLIELFLEDENVKDSLEKAYAYAIRCKDPVNRSDLFLNIAFTRIAFGDSPVADGEVQEMLEEMRRTAESENLDSLLITYHTCNSVWKAYGEEERARHAVEAVRLARENEPASFGYTTMAYGELAGIAEREGNYLKARQFYKKAAKLALTYQLDILNYYDCIRIADCCLQLSEPENAVRSIERIDMDFLAQFDRYSFDEACKLAFRAYGQSGRHRRALMYAEAVLDEGHLQKLALARAGAKAMNDRISELEHEKDEVANKYREANDRWLAADDETERLEGQYRRLASISFVTLMFGFLFACVLVYGMRLSKAKLELTTQKLEAEELRQESHRERSQSLVLMASGIAHDFNNILTGVLTNAEIARMDVEDRKGQSALESIDLIIECAVKASDLSNQLLTFTGKRKTEQVPEDLNLIVEQNQNLLASGQAPVLVTKNETPLVASVDRTQVEQVLLNLVGNSQKASTAESVIRIRLYETELDEWDLQQTDFVATTAATGAYIAIEVLDQGVGIQEQARKQIFEPFYSGFGEGRGLGLAVVRGVMMAHNGAIRVDSHDSGGTQVTAYFPSSRTDSCLTSTQEAVSTDTAATHHDILRGLRVLVVDDESIVSRAVESILAKHAVQVAVAETGAQALSLLQRDRDFDLILLDIVMPQMSGVDVLQAYAGSTPVLFMTGNSKVGLKEIRSDRRVLGVLEKPFELARFVQLIQKSNVLLKLSQTA